MENENKTQCHMFVLRYAFKVLCLMVVALSFGKEIEILTREHTIPLVIDKHTFSSVDQSIDTINGRNLSHELPKSAVETRSIEGRTEDIQHDDTERRISGKTDDPVANETMSMLRKILTNFKDLYSIGNFSRSSNTERNRREVEKIPQELDFLFHEAIGTDIINSLSFYLIDFPFARLHSAEDYTLWTFLQNHPSRVSKMKDADLFFFPCTNDDLNGRESKVKCNYTSNFTEGFDRQVERGQYAMYYHKSFHMALRVMEAFDDLKQKNLIRKEAWMVSWRNSIGSMQNRVDVVKVDQITFRGSSLATYAHGDNDVTHMPFNEHLRGFLDAENGSYIPGDAVNCSRRNDSHLIFFQGRNHGSWRSDSHFHFQGKDIESNSTSLEYRIRHIRKRIQDALQGNKMASENGIHVYMVDRRHRIYDDSPYNYDESMRSHHYCLAPAGNEPWSYRFYEAMHINCIPIVVSGGWSPPLSPAIRWDRVLLDLPDAFPYGQIEDLTMFARARDEKGNPILKDLHPLHSIYQGSFCKWHTAIHNLWEFVRTDDNVFRITLWTFQLQYAKNRKLRYRKNGR
mmetsp:Transcript_22213/g.33095  ORF Transcript_22213/g.33095 Transcript_22213/m.33095 type:complete len:570 (-) Transcript_22213:165-1874(-)